ncbi:MAG: choice-of-anchor D domain-containing protein, partial [Terriglobales bacterium]
MRLPQSHIRSLFLRTVHFLTVGLAITLIGMVPVSAGATAPQLTCTPSSLRFGGVVVGQTETLVVPVTNTGTTSVTVSGTTVTDSEFTTSQLSLPLTLLAGQSVNVSVSFTPKALGWAGGTIKFSSNASNATLTLQVEGGGVSSEAVTARPSIVSFGQVAIGASSTLPIVLTNARPWNVTLWPLQTAGSEFSISTSGGTFPLTLGRGQSVTLNVTFAPRSVGTTGGSLYIPGPALAIPLIATGKAGAAAGQLTVTPAALNFGSVPDGTTATQSISLSATGSSVTISSSASSSSQFVLDGTTLPLTVIPGQSVSLNVAFTPQSSGTVSGSLSFASNASNSGTPESLTGVGTATQYSVNLSWNPSSDVMGYNVYRSTAANGKYSKINSSVNP